jgi:DNA-directed RNA polymerase subunit E'/Rpb7
MEHGFITAMLTNRVKIQPAYVNKDFEKYVKNKLVKTFEGKCSHHGYIKPGSIDIVKMSCGVLKDVTLNGDTVYNVSFNADVCNPIIGSILAAKVINTNMFGILAESGLIINGGYIAMIEIIIAKNSGMTNSSVNLDNIKIGDSVNVEVMGKKFELDDKKITVIGRVVDTQPSKENKKAAKALIENEDDTYESDNEDNDVNVDTEDDEDDEDDDEEEDDDDVKSISSMSSFAGTDLDDDDDNDDDDNNDDGNVSDASDVSD